MANVFLITRRRGGFEYNEVENVKTFSDEAKAKDFVTNQNLSEHNLTNAHAELSEALEPLIKSINSIFIPKPKMHDIPKWNGKNGKMPQEMRDNVNQLKFKNSQLIEQYFNECRDAEQKIISEGNYISIVNSVVEKYGVDKERLFTDVNDPSTLEFGIQLDDLWSYEYTPIELV